LIDFARARDITIVVLSEYGITNANHPIDINRVLRNEGLLEVYTQDGMEYLDPWVSKAFAVSDHQVAHVYINDPQLISKVRELISGLHGVERVLDEAGKKEMGVAHDRAGELVAIADNNSWFTYYYWLDNKKAPDFAKNVEIHRKPGYDPAELFFDPHDKFVKAKAGVALARKMTGFRYNLSVVPLDPSPVSGSHGRLPDNDDDAPVFLCSDPSIKTDRVSATEVRDLLLKLTN
jgi:hypothetical protein